MTSVSKDREKWNPSFTDGGSVKWYSYFGKQAVPQRVKQSHTGPRHPTPSIYPEQAKAGTEQTRVCQCPL